LKFLSPSQQPKIHPGAFTPSVGTPAKTCLKSPSVTPQKTRKLNFTSPKVGFNNVEVRHYERCIAGGSALPDKGGYSLGLDWKYDETNVLKKSIAEYEQEKSNRTEDLLCKISEKERKEILEASSVPVLIEQTTRKGLLQQLKTEDAKIRQSRKRNGCGCSFSKTACDTKKCFCFKNGIECNEDSCGCNHNSCKNPLRHQFDSAKVEQFVQSKLKFLNSPRKLPLEQDKTL